MTETPQNPPAGYYPDSNGVQRYWDGKAWNDQAAPSSAAPTATATASNPKADAKAAKAYAKASRPWFKKKRWWLAIIILVAILATALGGGGSDGPEKVGGDDSSSSSAGGDDNKAGSKSNPIKVGETVSLEGTEYTVNSAKTSATVGGEFLKEEAGGIFVVVELTIENKKDETKTFAADSSKFLGNNKKKYSTDDDGSISVEDPLIFEDMQPDVPKTGTLVYDVPKDAAKGGILEVSDLFGNGSAYIDLGLK